MAKPFMTYDQQLQKMRDKHLIIADDDRVKETLRQVGYFSLMIRMYMIQKKESAG